MSAGGWIGVDLDGTLAEYGGWKGADHIGAPVPAMLARVRAWLADAERAKADAFTQHPTNRWEASGEHGPWAPWREGEVAP